MSRSAKHPLAHFQTPAWRRVGFAFAVFAVSVFANWSLLVGWLQTPPGTRFLGLRTLLPADTPVYESYLAQIEAGSLTLRDLYTAEPQPVGTFNILWLLVGWCGKVFHFSPQVIFHLSRVFLGAGLLIVLWWAVRWFLPSQRERWIGWLLMLSGGIGALVVPFLPAAEYLNRGAGYRFPVDLWLPWGYPILSLAQSPHLVASWALLVSTILAVGVAVERRRFSLAVISGVAAAVLLNFHPYHWPTLLAVLAVWFLLHWIVNRKPPLFALPYFAPLIIGMAVSLAYHGWLLGASPVAGIRSFGNVSRLPPWPYVVAGIGLLLPLALASMLRLRRTSRARDAWVLAWVLASTLLIAVPSQFQARYVQGLLVPLSIFAAPVVVAAGRWIQQRFHWVGLAIGGAILCIGLYGSPVTLLNRDIDSYRSFPSHYYFPQDFFSAAQFIQKIVPPGEPILASHDSALFLGAYTGRTLYYGHGDETVGSVAKRALVERFYTTTDDAVRAKALDIAGVHYVWYGWFERELGGPNLGYAPGKVLIFVNDHVQVYWFQ